MVSWNKEVHITARTNCRFRSILRSWDRSPFKRLNYDHSYCISIEGQTSKHTESKNMYCAEGQRKSCFMEEKRLRKVRFVTSAKKNIA